MFVIHAVEGEEPTCTNDEVQEHIQNDDHSLSSSKRKLYNSKVDNEVQLLLSVWKNNNAKKHDQNHTSEKKCKCRCCNNSNSSSPKRYRGIYEKSGKI